MNDNKSDFVLLELVRDALIKNPEIAMPIIEEQQRKSNIDFSVIKSSLKNNKVDCALAVANHELKRIGMLVVGEKITIQEPILIKN